MAQDTARLNTTRVFAALVVLGAFGMAFFGGVGLIERYSMPWIYGPIATVSFGAIGMTLYKENIGRLRQGSSGNGNNKIRDLAEAR